MAAPDRVQRRMLLAGLLGGTLGPDIDDAILDDAAAQTAGGLRQFATATDFSSHG